MIVTSGMYEGLSGTIEHIVNDDIPYYVVFNIGGCGWFNNFSLALAPRTWEHLSKGFKIRKDGDNDEKIVLAVQGDCFLMGYEAGGIIRATSLHTKAEAQTWGYTIIDDTTDDAEALIKKLEQAMEVMPKEKMLCAGVEVYYSIWGEGYNCHRSEALTALQALKNK